MTIPIKIQCGCGQRYGFDFELIAGRLPSGVACPVCGADGTAAAREAVVPSLATQPAPSAVATATAAKASSNVLSTAQKGPKSILGRISATLGIVGAALFYLSLVLRTSEWGFAAASNLGNSSPAMRTGRLLGVIALLLGIIALFRQSRKCPAIIGIVSGILAAFVPLLL